jgi:micrococcal nuclease
VVNVVDGDTVDVVLSGARVRLRLIGIDTPETVDSRKPVQCFGKEASARAKELLSGKTVWLEADPTQDNRDAYERLLRYLWLPDGPVLFNLVMVADGYAHEYTYDQPYKYQAAFTGAEAAAREQGKGLWAASTCNGDTVQALAQAKPTVPPTTTPRPIPPTATPRPLPPTATSVPPMPTKAGGRADPETRNRCPASHPIKGNADSGIYHVPGGQFYNATNPEDCFATEEDARTAGYRRSLR